MRTLILAAVFVTSLSPAMAQSYQDIETTNTAAMGAAAYWQVQAMQAQAKLRDIETQKEIDSLRETMNKPVTTTSVPACWPICPKKD